MSAINPKMIFNAPVYPPGLNGDQLANPAAYVPLVAGGAAEFVNLQNLLQVTDILPQVAVGVTNEVKALLTLAKHTFQ